MKKITLFSLLLLSLSGYSQNFEWVKTPSINFSWNPDMIGYNTATDPSGNVYFTGFKNNAFAYEDIMGNQYFNKYDTNGNLIFSKEFIGHITIYRVATDPQGNVLMSIGYHQNFSFGDFSLSNNLQDVQHHLFKFDPEGTMLWQKAITVPEWFVSGFHAITTDAAGNIYIGYDDFANSYIDKLTPEGNVVLSIVQSNVSRITSVSVDNEGNIYAAGSCGNSSASFNGTVAGTSLQYNTYAVKYSPIGQYQWSKFVEDITCPSPEIIALSPNEVYYSSYLFGAITFDGIATEGPASGFEDFFLAKLNSSGGYQWVREVPGMGTAGMGQRNFLSSDNNGNIIFAGRTGGTIDWGNNITTSAAPMGSDLLVVKYNPDGQVIMAKTAGGEGHDRIDCVAVSPEGDILVSGMVNGDSAFDDISFEADNFTFYPFMTKLSSGILSTKPIALKKDALLYPNPATNVVYIKNLKSGIKVIILNMLGQEIKALTISDDGEIDIDNLEKGAYILRAEGFTPIKFIKN